MIKKTNSIVEVDLSKLKNNLQVLLSNLDADTEVMAVVKADGYGHGAVEVASTLEPEVDAFAVNDLNEGIQLRKQGVAKPILVFEVPEKSTATQYRVHNLTATISAQEHFDWLPNGTSYHLNFDTGMGRMGFRPEEAQRISKIVKDYDNLFCTGIYSHFATADQPGSNFVSEQQKLFEQVIGYFPSELTTHVANTGASAFYSNNSFDMVRLGIGLYGYPPGETSIEGLAPIMQWKTRLVQIKSIVANTPVSYGATWKAPMDGYLGIIPVGYDDGLKRGLSGNVQIQINGSRYPLVGKVTMNYSMVFLGKDQFKPGTRVDLFYSDSDAWDWASKIDTIAYEILTSVNTKIPREYIL
ncbi:alanine racemase [Fodinibius sp. Rm-B-1B1-1]|uniref:alanine racemase n=1 Tax=Fodinibius alkaliphilus TaxID=3140241 RepID=UPI003159D0DF